MFSLFHSLNEQTGDTIIYHTHSQLDHFNQNMDEEMIIFPHFFLEFKLKKLINGCVAYKGYTT